MKREERGKYIKREKKGGKERKRDLVGVGERKGVEERGGGGNREEEI
jgi:hypothetical protein